jgi:hypothetical protein
MFCAPTLPGCVLAREGYGSNTVPYSTLGPVWMNVGWMRGARQERWELGQAVLGNESHPMICPALLSASGLSALLRFVLDGANVSSIQLD